MMMMMMMIYHPHWCRLGPLQVKVELSLRTTSQRDKDLTISLTAHFSMRGNEKLRTRAKDSQAMDTGWKQSTQLWCHLNLLNKLENWQTRKHTRRIQLDPLMLETSVSLMPNASGETSRITKRYPSKEESLARQKWSERRKQSRHLTSLLTPSS